MKREFLTTGDGSVTIHLPEWNEQYHSKHGALAEAQHVFIKTGLYHFVELHKPKNISILEIGFGTGLNALLTLLEAKTNQLTISYHGVEGYPVAVNEVEHLNYAEIVNTDLNLFLSLHSCDWEKPQVLSPYFTLTKRELFFNQIEDTDAYHIIYFDAFGARVQPELWTELIFEKMYHALKDGGVLVTYSAKGSVRRAMQAVGFTVERLPGPPVKREMLRATK